MKMDFKRFLSSLLAFVMTVSAMTIGNVSGISAAAKDTTDVFMADDDTAPSWLVLTEGTKATYTDANGLAFADNIFDNNTTNAAINHSGYLFAGSKSFQIKIKGDADLKVYMARRENSGATVTHTTSSGTGTVALTGSTAANITTPTRKDTTAAAIEYTITGAADGSESTYNFKSGNNNLYVFRVELTYDSALNGGGGGSTEVTYNYAANVVNADSLAGTVTVKDPDGVTGNTYSQTVSSGIPGNVTFTYEYNGPDYRFSGSVECEPDGTADIDVAAILQDAATVVKQYTVKGNITGTATGELKIGDTVATVTGNTYEITVPYSASPVLTYTSTDGSSMADVDLTSAFSGAFDSTLDVNTYQVTKDITITDGSDPSELTAVEMKAYKFGTNNEVSSTTANFEVGAGVTTATDGITLPQNTEGAYITFKVDKNCKLTSNIGNKPVNISPEGYSDEAFGTAVTTIANGTAAVTYLKPGTYTITGAGTNPKIKSLTFTALSGTVDPDPDTTTEVTTDATTEATTVAVSDGKALELLNVSDAASLSASGYCDSNKIYAFVTGSGKLSVDTSNATGTYDLTASGYTYNDATTINVTKGLQAGGNSTTSGTLNRVVVFNLSQAGDVVIGSKNNAGRKITISNYDASTQTIGTEIKTIDGDGTLQVTPVTGLSAGCYAITFTGTTRLGFVGATVPFDTVPGEAVPLTVKGTITTPAAEEMRLTITVGDYTETIVVPANATTFEFKKVPDTAAGMEAKLSSSTHEFTGTKVLTLSADETAVNTFTIETATPIVYAYKVDTTGLNPAPTGNFTFKSGSTELAADGTVVKTSSIDVYYDGTDYSFTGGYTSMTAGTADSSKGVSIDTTTTPNTMVLTLANCAAFEKALGETHVYRETVEDTETRKEWIYKLQSGNYEKGYLPLSNIVADSGVINPTGTAIGHGPNGEYAGEAYGGIDTKDTPASSGENKVLATPGTGAELIDTNGDDTNGLISTLYLPLPENISTGKVTVTGSVYTNTAKSQWTMLQVGDIGGLRTSQSSTSPTVYGLRLGNGSASNSPYGADADTSQLFNVLKANETTINASTGWMEYQLVVDFETKKITLTLGTTIVEADISVIPQLADGSTPSIGYIKAMTDTKAMKDVTVGDTTIVWEPPVAKTTALVTLDAINKTTDYYNAVVYDADGEVIKEVNISAGTTDNETAESLSLGELPAGDYTIQYLHNGEDASTKVDITTNSFTVTEADFANGKTVETTITEKAKTAPKITVTVTNNATNGESYPARLFMVNENNEPILLPGQDSAITDSYLHGKINTPASVGDVTTWVIDCNELGLELPDGTYTFIIESGHNLVSTVTQEVVISSVDNNNEYTGAVTLDDAKTDGLVEAPWNETDNDYYEFGSNKANINITDGTYTGTSVTDGPQNGNKYFLFDSASVTQDKEGVNIPNGDTFVFIPEKDSKLVIVNNNSLSFAPEVYATSDMSAARGEVGTISKTGTYTYYVKAGVTYTIYGVKSARIKRLQLRPIDETVTTLDVTVDAINKAEKDAVVNIYDGSTFVESITVPASQTTALNIPLTKKYTAGKTYTFTSTDNSIKIESQTFSIPAGATSYTAKVTLGVPQGLNIVLRNAPSSYNITFNGTTNKYTTSQNTFSYNVVAGQKYEIKFANEAQITKWPTKDWFTYDKTAKKYYITVPADFTAGDTIYFDFLSDPLNTQYAKDNTTSVANASVGYGQYGFGDEKAAITDYDARTTLTYIGITPSLVDFRGSYEYSARGDLALGYDGTASTDGVNGTIGYNNDGTLDDNRLLINANMESYVQFTSEVDGMCKLDRSMGKISVYEDGSDTALSTTTSTNGNYQFFSVSAGKTYKIVGNSKTSNTHVKSVRIFPKDNLFHFENLQNVGAYSDDVAANETLKTNGNVTVTAQAGVNAGDVMYRLFGYLEREAVNQNDIFDSIDCVGWTFVKKSDVDTYESSNSGRYNPNMTLGETTREDMGFAGIDPNNNKHMSGRSLYEAVYDYSKEPVNGEYQYMAGFSGNGPYLLRHIAASAGTEYYAYPYTIYKGTSVKSYTLSTDPEYGENGTIGALWRTTVTF